MKFDIKNTLKYILSLSLAFYIIFKLNSSITDIEKNYILNSINNVDYLYIILYTILGILAMILRALRWGFMLEAMNYKPKKMILISSIFIMYMANFAFPRLGEVLRGNIIKKYNNIPLDKSIGTMITERIIDVLGLSVFIILAIFIESEKFLTFFDLKNLLNNFLYKTSFTQIFIFILLLVSIFSFLYIFKQKIIVFVKSKLNGVIEGLLSIKKLKNFRLFSIYSFLIYSIYLVSVYIGYYIFNDLKGLPFKSTFMVISCSSIGVVVTQGGVGAIQYLTTKALEMYGIATKIGLAYSWFVWILQIIFIVFCSIFGWLYLMFSTSKSFIDGKK